MARGGGPQAQPRKANKMPKTFSAAAIAITFATALCAVAAQTPPTPSVYQVPPADEGPKVPEGFTPIFNGKDLTGWHVSKTNHHGTTPDYRVLHGVIVGTQNPRGKGGILLTDKNTRTSRSTSRSSRTGAATAACSSARARPARRIRSRSTTCPAAAWAASTANG